MKISWTDVEKAKLVASKKVTLEENPVRELKTWEVGGGWVEMNYSEMTKAKQFANPGEQKDGKRQEKKKSPEGKC